MIRLASRSGTSFEVLKRGCRYLTTDGQRLILAIESSCDDSCAALVSATAEYCNGDYTTKPRIHSNIVTKHDNQKHGAIHPIESIHKHMVALPPTIKQALDQGIQDGIYRDVSDIDAIAVTQGPGMNRNLGVGLTNAKLLSVLWNRPLIHVHHMVAHTLTPFMLTDTNAQLQFPFLAILMSGGHSMFVLCRAPNSYKILCNTMDIAIGNAIDRGVRALDISVDWSRQSPGRALEEFAIGAKEEPQFQIPRPPRALPALSFSGTASFLKELVTKNRPEILAKAELHRQCAADYQRALFAHVVDRLRTMFPRAGFMQKRFGGEETRDLQDIVVSGGVASNTLFRKMIQRELVDVCARPNVRLHYPPIAMCTDNAAMIANAAFFQWDKQTFDLSALPRAEWSLEDYSSGGGGGGGGGGGEG